MRSIDELEIQIAEPQPVGQRVRVGQACVQNVPSARIGIPPIFSLGCGRRGV
jgi:hypothetical protein